jgi:hypothetical protein
VCGNITLPFFFNLILVKRYFFSICDTMEWANLHYRARLHAATEPGFLAVRHLEMVTLHGGHLGFCMALGLDLATPEGRAAMNFHAALIIFCYDLCSRGVGHLPYNPAPLNQGFVAAGPAGEPPGNAPGGQGGAPPPNVDDDFVEVIGGVDPVHGPWAVDNDFVEVIGGIDPIHGPWVEGGFPAPNMFFDLDELANQMVQEIFGPEEINQDGEGDQEDVPEL